jgi:hypothetical protein
MDYQIKQYILQLLMVQLLLQRVLLLVFHSITIGPILTQLLHLVHYLRPMLSVVVQTQMAT